MVCIKTGKVAMCKTKKYDRLNVTKTACTVRRGITLGANSKKQIAFF